MSDRLEPLRSIRLYCRIARNAISTGHVGLALAAVKNIREDVARLQEFHVKQSDR